MPINYLLTLKLQFEECDDVAARERYQKILELIDLENENTKTSTILKNEYKVIKNSFNVQRLRHNDSPVSILKRKVKESYTF